jgi:F0F1-type ATP synthase epsilon subunit
MGILKDHISLVTFLRPGFIEVQTDKGSDKFFVEDGIVEFNNNHLLILSSTAINIKNLSKNQIDKMIQDSEEIIGNKDIKDKEKYILSYKLDTLKEIRQ